MEQITSNFITLWNWKWKFSILLFNIYNSWSEDEEDMVSRSEDELYQEEQWPHRMTELKYWEAETMAWIQPKVI